MSIYPLCRFLCILILTNISIACSDSTDPNITYKLNGTLHKSDVSDGIRAYMKLVDKKNSVQGQALYTASTTFHSGTASYSTNGISEGEYTLYAFIDVNSNASGDENSLPDSGDYVTSANIVVDRDLTLNPSEDDWLVY